jgi:hypothetical protein
VTTSAQPEDGVKALPTSDDLVATKEDTCSGTDPARLTLVGIRSVLSYGRIFRLLIRDGRQLTAREVAGRQSV